MFIKKKSLFRLKNNFLNAQFSPKAALDLELTKELESKFEPIKQQQQQLQLQKELEQQILEKKRQQQQRQIELQVLQQQQQQQIQQNEAILQSPKLSYTSPTPTAQQQQLISSLNRTSYVSMSISILTIYINTY
jgi:hypothetical protein